MSNSSLVNKLKDNGQDFEFYPTTREMISVIYRSFRGHRYDIHSVLDIGCGTCNFLKHMKSFIDADESENVKGFPCYYVMEKSKILIDRLPKDAIVLGTDFNTNALIDKQVDAIFCNPPYSEFENWTERIIRESLAKFIYFVIPQRWKESAIIKQAIAETDSTSLVLGSFDFLNAERQARAKVDVVLINKRMARNSAFDDWFDKTFKIEEEKPKFDEREQVKNELLTGKNKIEILVNGYNSKLQQLQEHFTAIATLDSETLEAIGIDKSKVKEALKSKIKGLKSFYWNIAFDELEEITSRLTYEMRKTLVGRFQDVLSVDFTAENIYALVVWVCKNASDYYNDQLINLFKQLSSPTNVDKYKSNQKMFSGDAWTWRRQQHTHYCLCNRIIVDYLFFRCAYSWKTELDTRQCQTIVNDLCAIAHNLGFLVEEKQYPTDFGEKYYIFLNGGKPLIEFKIYQNGNTHLKLSKDFAQAMNVEVSRLLGWISSKEDIAKEFPDEMAKGAEKYYGVLKGIKVSNILLLQ